jgi:hypothetical protein
MTTQNVLTKNIGNHASTQRNRVLRLIAVAALATAISACHSAPPTSPTQMAHCSHAYGMWLRYLQAFVDQTGERAIAEKTLYDCQNGKYDTEALEAILEGRGLPAPMIAGAAPILPP